MTEFEYFYPTSNLIQQAARSAIATFGVFMFRCNLLFSSWVSFNSVFVCLSMFSFSEINTAAMPLSRYKTLESIRNFINWTSIFVCQSRTEYGIFIALLVRWKMSIAVNSHHVGESYQRPTRSITSLIELKGSWSLSESGETLSVERGASRPRIT